MLILARSWITSYRVRSRDNRSHAGAPKSTRAGAASGSQMIKKRRTYLPRIVGDKVMMPADLKRLHKYMLDVEHIGIVI